MLIESEALKKYCRRRIAEFEKPPVTDIQIGVAAGINDVLVTIKEIEDKQKLRLEEQRLKQDGICAIDNEVCTKESCIRCEKYILKAAIMHYLRNGETKWID